MVTVTAAPDARSGVEEPGTVIGSYKLLEVIGEGGMGTVYMAEQMEPVRRRVALKVIKPGMDSKQVVARFEAERQALAMMDHPNIAKVHDGGMTPAGRPYFVMELVRGLTITEYCDQHQLSIPERLELFTLVCRAVQHAHQKGVIHRDLKPSNVLVTDIDGVATPKVIDFGVAKATGQALTEKTFFTGFHQFVGTPLYVSPEQAELSGADVDTRSDIYSLGVLLYELLTGTTPFDSETLRRAAFDEMRRIIREEEPPRPSTRLSTLGDRLSAVSSRRKADPKRLGNSLKGELDWVVMKALEKDRRRRYETASDFAADVMRHLTDRPVEAFPPSTWYRVKKYARRNRVDLAFAGTASAALTVAVLSLAAGFVISEHQRAAAVSQRDLARRAVDEMYTQVAEKWLINQPSLTPLQREFLEKASSFYEGFAQDPGSDPTMRHAAAEAADRFGQILEKLGRDAEAEAAYRKALAFEIELSRQFPNDPEYHRGLGRAYYRLSGVRSSDYSQGHKAEMEQAGRQAIAIQERLVTGHPAMVDYRRDLAKSYWTWGGSLERLGRSEDAERAIRKAVDIGEGIVREPGAQADDRLNLASTLGRLAVTLRRMHRLPEADTASARGIELGRQLVAGHAERPDIRYQLALSYMNRGALEQDRGRPEELQRVEREAIKLLDRLVADFPLVRDYRAHLAVSYSNLGVALWNASEEWEAAKPPSLRAIELLEALVTDFPEDLDYKWLLVGDLANLGDRLLKANRDEEALEVYRRAARACEAIDAYVVANPGVDFRNNLVELADALATYPAAGALIHDLALEIARKAVELRPNDQMSRRALGWAQYRVGDFKGCNATLEQVPKVGPNPQRQDGTQQVFLAMARWQLGEKDRARAEFARADEWITRYEATCQEQEKRGQYTYPYATMLKRFRDEAASLLGVGKPATERDKPAKVGVTTLNR